MVTHVAKERMSLSYDYSRKRAPAAVANAYYMFDKTPHICLQYVINFDSFCIQLIYIQNVDLSMFMFAQEIILPERGVLLNFDVYEGFFRPTN